MPGAAAQDIHVLIQQQGAMATATVSGLAAVIFYVVLGTYTFQGSVQGDSFTLTAVGSNPIRTGACTYTIKATMTGAIGGDAIQGTVTYTETTNGSLDCGHHSTCSSVQTFAGVRASQLDGG